MKIFTKIRRMRILGARIFLSLLAGKLETFKRPLLHGKYKGNSFAHVAV